MGSIHADSVLVQLIRFLTYRVSPMGQCSKSELAGPVVGPTQGLKVEESQTFKSVFLLRGLLSCDETEEPYEYISVIFFFDKIFENVSCIPSYIDIESGASQYDSRKDDISNADFRRPRISEFCFIQVKPSQPLPPRTFIYCIGPDPNPLIGWSESSGK